MSAERDQRVYALFDEALRLDPAGRAALLSEHCAGDTELRAELERLLAWDEAAEREQFLAPADPLATSASGSACVPPVSRWLGRFELIEAVGAGAFGMVYRARDPHLDRTVAIKVPCAGSLATEDDRNRFLREARNVARLRHSAIVPVHEVGEDDQVRFLVSEFVHGVTLGERLAARPYSPHEAARLAAEVADALEYAHGQGVVHRDVKPSNILLDAAGRPHLTDFGLARRDAGEVTMTIDGQVLGTPAYMSPEQARGEGHHVDGRSDVYSLGVVLYELLSGERPFRGDARVVLHQVLHDEPRPLRKLDARIPRDLDTICAMAMAKEPARRYATAGDFAADLRRFLAAESIQARPSGALEKGWRWCRRRPLATGLAAALLLAVVGGLGATSLAWRDLRHAERDAAASKRDAVLSKARAGEQAELAGLRLYDVRMTQVQRHWEESNGQLFRGTLDEQLPERQWGVDRRGFEWFYWHRKLWEGHVRLETGGVPVTSLAYSPDGLLVAGVSPGATTVRIWDVAGGREIAALDAHAGGVSSVAFSPKGNLVASAGEDRTVKLWDAATRQKLRTLEGHADRVMGVAFSPDGRLLASAGDDRTVKVWNVADGREIHALRGHTAAVWSVAFSPDGRRLASGSSAEGTVRVWDVDDGRETLTLEGHTGGDKSVAWSPDGLRLASAGFLGTVKVWDATSGKESLTLKGHTDQVQGVAYAPDGRLVASASDDGSVRVWDAATGSELRTFKGHARWVRCVAFSPDSRLIASGSLDGGLKLWDTSNRPETSTLHEPASNVRGLVSEVRGLAFSPDGRLVAFGNMEGTVNVWDIVAGRETAAFKGQGAPGDGWVTAVVFSPNGRLLASAHRNGLVRVEDVARRETDRILKGYRGEATSVAFSPDGRYLASGSLDGMMRLWVSAFERPISQWRDSGRGINGVAFSPDGHRLAAASADGTVTLWNFIRGEKTHTFRGPTPESVEGVAFSPDGRLLASAGRDSTVRLWDPTTGRVAFTLAGHRKRVSGVAFSPDGRRLASGSDDGTVKLWDTATGQETLTLRGHTKVDAGAFSPDGHVLASAGGLQVKLWDARPLDTWLARPSDTER